MLGRSFPASIQAECGADGIDGCEIAFARGGFQGLQWLVQEFIHEAMSEGFDGGLLRGRERLQTRLGAAEFSLAHFFGSSLKIDERRHHVEGFDAALAADELLLEDGLGLLRFASSVRQIRRSDALQVVDVVEKDAVEAVDLGIDITGHGNVDEEYGAVAAAVEKLLCVGNAEDEFRRPGGGNEDVGFVGARVQIVKADDVAVEFSRQMHGAFLGTIGDKKRTGSLLHEVPCGEFAHFACTDEKDTLAFERAEDFAGKIDSDGSDGDGG